MLFMTFKDLFPLNFEKKIYMYNVIGLKNHRIIIFNLVPIKFLKARGS